MLIGHAPLRVVIAIAAITAGVTPAFSQNLDNLSSQTPLKLSGSIQASSSVTGASGTTPFAPPFASVLTGSPVLSIYGLSLPFSFSITNTGNSFRQPFNEFGVSPTWKWATLHLGYRSMTFSPFTLAGATFLGGGAEANPGILRLGFMYGRFQRPIQASPLLTPRMDTIVRPGLLDTIIADTSRLGFAGDSAPAFRRMGLGVKLGIGSQANNVDLIFFRAEDDTTSISARGAAASNVTPSRNVIAGLTSHQQLWSHLAWDVDGAVSTITRDLLADTVPASMLNIPSYIKDLVHPNISTSFAWALQSGLRLSWDKVATALLYKRVQPGYTSLGSYFIQNDVEEYSLAPSCRIAQGKLTLGGKIGLQHDNLANNKPQTTQRIVGSANASFHPTAGFGLDASYCNYTTGQKSKLDSLYDSLGINQTMHTVSLTPMFMSTGKIWSHLFLITGQLQSLVDRVRSGSGMWSLYDLASYSATHQALALTLTPSIAWTHTAVTGLRTELGTGGFRISKGWFNNALSASLDNSGGYEWNSMVEVADKVHENSGLQCSWNVAAHHTFSARFSAANTWSGGNFQSISNGEAVYSVSF